MSSNALPVNEEVDVKEQKVELDDRLPPCNYEAEQALLGALLHNNAAYEKVVDFLKPIHFANSLHGRIFSTIGRMIEQGQVADPITLHKYFEEDVDLKELGGTKYIAHIANSVVSIINVQDYGRIIYNFYIRRQLINLGEDVVNDAYKYDFNDDVLNQIEKAEQRLFDLVSIGQTERDFQDFSSALTSAIQTAETAFKRDGHIVGVTTGFVDIDKRLGGLHPSDLIIIAGRPSMGKTALATNIAFNAALAAQKGNNGAGVAFFSLEMSSEQLAMRLLAQETKIPSDKIRRGELANKDFPKFVDVSQQLSTLPLFIDDTPALSISALRTRARRLKRKFNIGLIIIDYLQLLQFAKEKNYRSDNRVQEISEITRSLKAIAKELDVPVIALSQLSRAVEQRDDKRPQLADLRESGSIEQDADVVMFVYREEYYEARKEPSEGTEKHIQWQEHMSKIYKLADIILAKQRHGPIGNIKLHFNGALTKFSNYTDDSQLPDVRT